jgi:lipoprotein-anchoring transpeptidase ErfK/SrfK
MRKILMIVALVALPLAALPAVAASTPQSEQELLLQKKKQAEAKRKAEARKKAAAERAALIIAKDKAAARLKLAEKKRASARRDCGDFLSCLFSSKPASRRQTASTTSASLDDMATAKVVSWAPSAKYKPGSIIVQTPERSLYFVLGDGKARRYKVGVGREGFQWSGNSKIVDKREWPTWRPPQVMIEREAAKGHILPEVMEGGPGNPLGARAMYIGGTMYRIHGTNNSGSIGGAVSSGCIRMMNSDVVDLYDRVKIGAKVYVYQ